MSLWFRAYSESLNDSKIQTLPLDAFKAWHNAMYLAAMLNSKDGNIGNIDAIAFAFRETKSSVSSAFQPLIRLGLLVTIDETFHIANWRKRQYKSDTSTERVKRFRKRSRNVTETAPDTDTDTDTDIKDTTIVVSKKPRKVSILMPSDWEPDHFKAGSKSFAISTAWSVENHANQFEAFCAHHRKLGNKFVDWQAAWSTWVLNSERFNSNANRNNSSKASYAKPIDGFTAACREVANRASAEPFDERGDGINGSGLPRITRLGYDAAYEGRTIDG